MTRISKKSSFVSLLIFSTLVFAMVVTAEPSVDNVTFDPAEPYAQAEITISATITNDDPINQVYLYVQECNPTICYITDINQTMVAGEDDSYEATATLVESDATYIKYNFKILSNGEWFETEKVNQSLFPPPTTDDDDDDNDDSNGNTNGNGNGGSNDTPGFEIIVFLGAMIISSLIILRRKRDK